MQFIINYWYDIHGNKHKVWGMLEMTVLSFCIIRLWIEMFSYKNHYHNEWNDVKLGYRLGIAIENLSFWLKVRVGIDLLTSFVDKGVCTKKVKVIFRLYNQVRSKSKFFEESDQIVIDRLKTLYFVDILKS